MTKRLAKADIASAIAAEVENWNLTLAEASMTRDLDHEESMRRALGHIVADALDFMAEHDDAFRELSRR